MMESDSLLASLATISCPPLTDQEGEVRAIVHLTDLSETLEPEGGLILPCSALHEILVGNSEQPIVFSEMPPSYINPSIINQQHLQSSNVQDK